MCTSPPSPRSALSASRIASRACMISAASCLFRIRFCGMPSAANGSSASIVEISDSRSASNRCIARFFESIKSILALIDSNNQASLNSSAYLNNRISAPLGSHAVVPNPQFFFPDSLLGHRGYTVRTNRSTTKTGINRDPAGNSPDGRRWKRIAPPGSPVHFPSTPTQY